MACVAGIKYFNLNPKPLSRYMCCALVQLTSRRLTETEVAIIHQLLLID